MTTNNPIRKEIIGHIEASGELACWLIPYLDADVADIVHKLERDGTLIIEVGKRGEPVYVFAQPAAPSASAVASETTTLDDGGTLTPTRLLKNGDRIGKLHGGKYSPTGKVDSVTLNGSAAIIQIDNGVDLFQIRDSADNVWYVEPKADKPAPPPAERAAQAAKALGLTLGDSGTTTVAGANAIKPVDTHAFYYGKQTVTGIEEALLDNHYILYLDISEQEVVKGDTTLTYLRWTPLKDEVKSLKLTNAMVDALKTFNKTNGFSSKFKIPSATIEGLERRGLVRKTGYYIHKHQQSYAVTHKAVMLYAEITGEKYTGHTAGLREAALEGGAQ